MAIFFNDKKVRDALSRMDPEKRETYVNGLIDMVGGQPSMKQGNQNLSTAYSNLGQAITLANTMPTLTQRERNAIQEYLKPLEEEG